MDMSKANLPVRRSARCAARRAANLERDSSAAVRASSCADNLDLGHSLDHACYAAPRISTRANKGSRNQKPDQVNSKSSAAVIGTAASSSGLWANLPDEVIDIILNSCTAQQLGMLETACTYFRKAGFTDKIAKSRLKAVPRARVLKPSARQGETYLSLLHFVNSQSCAAAQATAVACGSHHSTALLIPAYSFKDTESKQGCKHSLYTFGRGLHGQLGNEAFTDSLAPSTTSLGYRTCTENGNMEEETMPAVVACGANHTASISRRGELFTWGFGSNGELGHGSWTALEVPVPRQAYAATRIVSLAAGAEHTLAIAENGSLWCCGSNKRGQLGTNHMQDVGRLTKVAALEGQRIVSAAAGEGHSMALAADGSLYTWGDGRYGQLGHPQMQSLASMGPIIVVPLPQKIARLDPGPLLPENRVTAIAAGALHSMALTVGGVLLAFGHNATGALGMGDTEHRWKPTEVAFAPTSKAKIDNMIKRVVQVACGSEHTVALVSNGGMLQVYTSGDNKWGQLGNGNKKSSSTFVRVCLNEASVSAVQSGDQHSVLVTAKGKLYVWGRGDSGQLGLNDTRCKWRPTLVKDFRVVHPDKTLRRSKRSLPNMRPVPDNKRQRLIDAVHM